MRVSMVQATGFLPLLLPLTITVHSAQLGSHSKRVALPFGQLGPFASRTIEKRVDEDGCPEAFDDDENTEFDAVTLDQEAGLGMEFETGAIHIDVDGDCDEDTSQLKGVSLGRSGQNWALTADGAQSGGLTAEYIIDGRRVKVGKDMAGPTADDIAADFADWNPTAGDSVDVPESKCKWKISSVDTTIRWAPQITAPLPFEAINDIIKKYVSGEKSPFLGTIRRREMVSVTADFFQSSPNGISKDSVKDDVLGFFSLLMSYAKNARDMDEDDSVKHLVNIMPRTDFVGLYDQVKSTLPGDGSLYDLIKVLGCYKNDGTLDTAYCGGSEASPEPGTKMDDQHWSETNSETSKTLTVKEWADSIEADVSPDLLSELDKIAHGQVGYFGTQTETIYGGTRSVPLFEFRRLPGTTVNNFKDFTINAENGVIEYSETYASPPSKKLRRRQDCASPPSSSSTPTTTSAPEPTEDIPPPVDTDSPEYLDCISDMGASSCGADDDQCLVDECKNNGQCLASNIDCETYGIPV